MEKNVKTIIVKKERALFHRKLSPSIHKFNDDLIQTSAMGRVGNISEISQQNTSPYLQIEAPTNRAHYQVMMVKKNNSFSESTMNYPEAPYDGWLDRGGISRTLPG